MGIKIKQVSATGSIKFINSVTGLTFKKITPDWSLTTDNLLNKQIRFQRGTEIFDMDVDQVVATMVDSTETAFSGTAEQLIIATESFFVKAPAGGGGGSPANLAIGTVTATTVPVTNSNGTGFTISAATSSLAGAMTAADKVKVDGIDAALALKSNSSLALTTKTANYTLALVDANSMISMNLAGANTLTVPLNSVVAFPLGTQILISQEGAGQITITPTGGVTLNSAGGKLKSNVQYSGITLVKKATDTWAVFGDLTT